MSSKRFQVCGVKKTHSLGFREEREREGNSIVRRTARANSRTRERSDSSLTWELEIEWGILRSLRLLRRRRVGVEEEDEDDGMGGCGRGVVLGEGRKERDERDQDCL